MNFSEDMLCLKTKQRSPCKKNKKKKQLKSILRPSISPPVILNSSRRLSLAAVCFGLLSEICVAEACKTLPWSVQDIWTFDGVSAPSSWDKCHAPQGLAEWSGMLVCARERKHFVNLVHAKKGLFQGICQAPFSMEGEKRINRHQWIGSGPFCFFSLFHFRVNIELLSEAFNEIFMWFDYSIKRVPEEELRHGKSQIN